MARERRDVFAIRSHRPGSGVDRVYRWAREVFDPADIFVVADQTGGKRYYWPSEYNVISIEEQFLERNALFNTGSDVGWRCGDYCYLAVDEVQDFDFLWLVEPDVVANFPLSLLLDSSGVYSADLVCSSLKRRDSSWSWHSSLEALGYADVYSVFFPLTGVSSRLVDIIRRERMSISDKFNRGADGLYPNDEAVAATVAMANSLSVVNLKNLFPEMFSHFLWGTKWLYPDVLEKFDRPKLVHPAVEDDQYAEYLRDLVSGPGFDRKGFERLGTSMWSISPNNYPKWRAFVVEELARRVDRSVFDR